MVQPEDTHLEAHRRRGRQGPGQRRLRHHQAAEAGRIRGRQAAHQGRRQGQGRHGILLHHRVLLRRGRPVRLRQHQPVRLHRPLPHSKPGPVDDAKGKPVHGKGRPGKPGTAGNQPASHGGHDELPVSGTLAETGSSDRLPNLAAIGGAAVLAGAGAVVIARRRRTGPQA
ncbi:LAETG motif-containing sortase-dependent surface protein [Streptomyces sp. Ac-502]|uniref:LAETG motif-containing sortase-dependent surface protein n=1 Tax=Streptomyces sp. Ac-502 TaxID=3342801 RepID=UPI003862C4E2